VTPLEIEHATLDAWPPAEVEPHLGWLFCAASGVTGRVNAVWPLAWQGESIDAAIDAAEAWYGARKLPPRFKLTDGAYAPSELTARLEARGYVPKTATYIMTRGLGDIARAEATVHIEERLTPEFERALAEATPDPQDLEERRAIALRAPAPKAFAVCGGAAPVAIGMSAVAGDLAGVFLMRTVPHARRQGHALTVLRALLAWAREGGARLAFLQVEASNTPAVRLYEREGFTALSTYRFWRKG
jgi:GNAT superfamily N-acetyltransferase